MTWFGNGDFAGFIDVASTDLVPRSIADAPPDPLATRLDQLARSRAGWPGLGTRRLPSVSVTVGCAQW